MNRATVARISMGLGILMAWFSLMRILRVNGIPHPRGLTALLDLSLLTTSAGFWTMTAVLAASTVAFVIRWNERLSLGVVVFLLALGGHLQMSQWPGSVGSNASLILPGAGGLAYLIGSAWSLRRGEGPAANERRGVDAACGVVAAGYTLAAINKLAGTGIAWATSSNLAIHITIHAHSGADFLFPFRLSVANSALLCGFFGIATLLIEGGFALFVLPRLRLPLAGLAVAMHLSIGLLLGLHHYDWMFMALGLGLYPRAFDRGAIPTGTDRDESSGTGDAPIPRETAGAPLQDAPR